MVRVLVATYSGDLHPAVVLIMQHRIEVLGLIGIAVAAPIIVDSEGHMSLLVGSDKGNVVGHRDEFPGRDQCTCIMRIIASSFFWTTLTCQNGPLAYFTT